ncbi:hypothetical protein KEX41_28150 (plasmid) [Burkholderia thailandensis]|uniref:hypothetical protein n=1 Tax=Burkholderia thailandensis TaxID=57975 RepID=UPI00192D6D0D|nr:hypothetical protein [Burkholderia thailandensis]MBS2132062.1 hypothetical protein [Burkholderia thailandensis]QRA15176.1 hypothetical protein JMY07_30185 [Burkholderia thailandensis]
MNDLMTDFQMSAWTVTDGDLMLNSSGHRLNAHFERVLIEQRRLSQSWAGAFLAALLIRHPWLDSVTLQFRVSFEYDDAGGSFRSFSAMVTDLHVVSGASFPQELTGDGQFDTDLAAAVIEADIDAFEQELYAALVEDDTNDDLAVVIARASIAHLLGPLPLDGRQAYQALLAHRTPG